MKRCVVVIPTYNEAENLSLLVPQVLAQGPGIEVLVVDDDSPDGTGKLADDLADGDPRVHTLHRTAKQGLGPAYRAGFTRALDLGADIVVQMDADFSHPPEKIREMCSWIVGSLGAEVPLHFIRFFPAYKMRRLPATPIETLEAAVAIADEAGLHYVYLGNVPGHPRNSTFCPACGARIIHRLHFTVVANDVVDGKCRYCGHPIAGIWAA